MFFARSWDGWHYIPLKASSADCVQDVQKMPFEVGSVKAIGWRLENVVWIGHSNLMIFPYDI